jgi:hypothetical protein
MIGNMMARHPQRTAPPPAVIVRDLPAPSSSTSTIGPIIGVVDGSDAAPGEVGEFLTGGGSFNYAAGSAAGVTTTGQLDLLNMPPGDWDFTVSAAFSTLITSALFRLNPQPTGVSNQMFGLNGNFTMAGEETSIIIGQSARGSFAVTTLMSFEVQVYQGTAALPAGLMTMRIEARRRR